jgi:hypothetical protein
MAGAIAAVERRKASALRSARAASDDAAHSFAPFGALPPLTFFGGEHFVPFVAKTRMRMHRENDCTHLSPLRGERSREPTGPARSGRPDDRLRDRGRGGLSAILSFNTLATLFQTSLLSPAATPPHPTLSPQAGRGSSERHANRK